MRLFLAIDFSDKIKKQLSDQLAGFRKLHQDFSWVEQNNYHITIQFFGEVKDIDRCIERIRHLLFDQPSFYLYSSNLDLFLQHKITFYLNFKREKKLEQLASSIRKDLLITDQKSFVPHLTVAKYRIPSKQQYFVIKKALDKQQIDIEIPVKKVVLFESILGSKEPVYKKVSTINLI